MRRPELDHIGVYFLFGDAGEGAKPIAYVGQTEDLRGRLKYHQNNKEFWTTAVMLVSKTDSFTLAHIRYLEWFSIRQAREAGRYRLDNGNAGGKPFINEPMEADVLDAFETGSILLSTLGFPIFEPLAGKGTLDADKPLFRCVGPDANGQGRLVEDGFVVLKGSLARAEITPSAVKDVSPKRQQLITSGVLVPNGSSLLFTEDYLFETPSGAAQMVLGRKANGWTEWKAADGRTLNDIERAHIDVEDEVAPAEDDGYASLTG
ncbi:MAG: hypothetical protein JWN24_2858 [Phycisphaerales bacterium]|nr:hypothetical protein [Phycisphaerales bacterium]